MRPASRILLIVGAASGAALAWWATRPAPPRPVATPGAPDPFPFRPIPRPAVVPAARTASRTADQAVAVGAAAPDTAPSPTPTADSPASWVLPEDDGTCPPTHPVKANSNSGIYHVPGGSSYDRTKAERCYTTAAAAESDGFRPAKR